MNPLKGFHNQRLDNNSITVKTFSSIIKIIQLSPDLFIMIQSWTFNSESKSSDRFYKLSFKYNLNSLFDFNIF